MWKGFLRCIKDYSNLDPVVAILRSLPQKQLLRALKDGGPDVHAAFTAHMGKFDHIPQRYLDALEKTKPKVSTVRLPTLAVVQGQRVFHSVPPRALICVRSMFDLRNRALRLHPHLHPRKRPPKVLARPRKLPLRRRRSLASRRTRRTATMMVSCLRCNSLSRSPHRAQPSEIFYGCCL